MSATTTIKCDGCERVYQGNVAIGYRPGGWDKLPIIGGELDICPDCMGAMLTTLRNRSPKKIIKDRTDPEGGIPGRV